MVQMNQMVVSTMLNLKSVCQLPNGRKTKHVTMFAVSIVF